jgi:hypothetical protein
VQFGDQSRKEEGHYFLDPDFEGGSVRLNEENGVSFVDTKPLTFNHEDTRCYLNDIVDSRQRRQLRITGYIFCVRYGRIKRDCIRLLQWVTSVARQPVSVYISDCRSRPEYMMRFFKDTCGIEDFFCLKAEVAEEMDERLGRWIMPTSELKVVRERIREKYGV